MIGWASHTMPKWMYHGSGSWDRIVGSRLRAPIFFLSQTTLNVCSKLDNKLRSRCERWMQNQKQALMICLHGPLNLRMLKAVRLSSKRQDPDNINSWLFHGGRTWLGPYFKTKTGHKLFVGASDRKQTPFREGDTEYFVSVLASSELRGHTVQLTSNSNLQVRVSIAGLNNLIWLNCM